MSTMTSNKPYLIRAIYDWIVDNGFTPYLLIAVDKGGVEVPMEFARDGRIVFNISPTACRGLHLENERIIFTARFSGEAMQVVVIPQTVLAIYAKENGQGMEFPEEKGPFPPPTGDANKAKSHVKPKLSLVKKDE